MRLFEVLVFLMPFGVMGMVLVMAALARRVRRIERRLSSLSDGRTERSSNGRDPSPKDRQTDPGAAPDVASSPAPTSPASSPAPTSPASPLVPASVMSPVPPTPGGDCLENVPDAVREGARDGVAPGGRGGVPSATRGPVPSERSGPSGRSGSSGRSGPSGRPVVEGWAKWFMANWFYVFAGASLMLAGIFAAEWAAERGIINPAMRIAGAFAGGCVLVGFGEWVRRRFGSGGGHEDGREDGRGDGTPPPVLSAVFSGAGVATLFGTVFAARVVYTMMDGGVAFAGVFLVAAFAVVLGWFHGAFLSVLGVVGATLAPFVIGADPGELVPIYVYFGAIVLTGLSANAFNHRRGVDGASVVLPFCAGWIVFLDTRGSQGFSDDLAFVVLSFAIAALAGVFGGGGVSRGFPGPSLISGPILGRRPDMSWRMASMLMIETVWFAAAIGMVAVVGSGVAHAFAQTGTLRVELVPEAVYRWFIFVVAVLPALAGLFAAVCAWSGRSENAPGLAVFPVLGLIGVVLVSDPLLLADSQVPAGPFSSAGTVRGLVRVSLGAMIASSVVMSLLSAWRAARAAGRARVFWGIMAAAVAPGVMGILEMTGAPSAVFGDWVWACVVMAVAALAVLLAERAARIDEPGRILLSSAAVAALSLVALALFVLLTEAALSLALSVLVVSACFFDWRFDLRPMSWFVQFGVAVLVYRAVVDPGLSWGRDLSVMQVVVAYFVPAGMIWPGLAMLRSRSREVAGSVVEGGVGVLSAVGAMVIVGQIIHPDSGVDYPGKHWAFGLLASIWLVLAVVYVRNAASMSSSGPATGVRGVAKFVRGAMAFFSFATAGRYLLAGVFGANPALLSREAVIGPVGLSSLVPAYLLPGVILLFIAIRLTAIGGWARLGAGLAGGLLSGLYVCLSIAQAWRGNAIASGVMRDGELWSYTAALVVAGGVLFVVSIAWRKRHLRYLANGILALAIGKVFLVDAADLDGLARVASFLVLGLVLAGLAWVVPSGPKSGASRGYEA